MSGRLERILDSTWWKLLAAPAAGLVAFAASTWVQFQVSYNEKRIEYVSEQVSTLQTQVSEFVVALGAFNLDVMKKNTVDEQKRDAVIQKLTEQLLFVDDIDPLLDADDKPIAKQYKGDIVSLVQIINNVQTWSDLTPVYDQAQIMLNRRTAVQNALRKQANMSAS